MLTQLTVNITVEQAQKLQKEDNKSEIVRKALEQYYKEE